jgi:hypothetical protein
MSLPTDSMPQTERGSKEKGCSGHGLRKASATIPAESGATEAELNAMFGWSGHQMAQLCTMKAGRTRNAELDAALIGRCRWGARTGIFAVGESA